MSLDVREKIQHLTTEGYEFDFGAYLSKAWKLLTANAGQFIIFSLLYIVISMVVGLIPIIGQLAGIIISPAMIAGYFYMARQADKEGKTELNTGFEGFRNLGKILPPYLLLALIMIGVMIPMMFVLFGSISSMGGIDPVAGIPDFSTGTSVLITLTVLVMLYLGISYSLWFPFAIFKDLGAWETLEASRKVVAKNFFQFFLLILVAGIISVLGILLLGVGILFTMPFSYLALYAAFDDIVGVDPDEEDESVIDHLIA